MHYLDDRDVHVCAHSVGAAYAGWLLRSMGAPVSMESALDPEGAGALFTPGAGPLRTVAGAAGVEATIVITDAPVNAANREAVDQAAARSRVVWITPWGLDEPWASQPATALTLQAAGGWMSAVGDPDREPLGPPGNQAVLVAGLWAAIAAASGATEPGLSVVSIAESTTSTMIYETVAYQYYERVRQRVGNRFGAANPMLVTLPVEDGYVGLHSPLHRQWVSFCTLAGCPEMIDNPRFRTNLAKAEHMAELDEEVLLPWFRERGRWDAYHQLQGASVPASATPDLSEVLASPQLKAREFWVEQETPSGTILRLPGPPARELATAGPGTRREGPLRVLELAMGWAGPLVGYVFAAMGADVVKVEGPDRYDWWRGSRAPGEDNQGLYERSHVFNSVNRGKRGVALDITSKGGRAQFLDLVATADVVIENFQAGVLERHGLGWDVLSTRNPGLILLRQPAFGSNGPEAHYRAFGNTIEGMSGLTSMLGYEGGPPMMMSNALGDPVSGLNATLALQAALHARERDGLGRCVEVAQLEGFLPIVGEELVAYQTTGELPRRRGNARPGAAVAGVYRCAGEDDWLALEAVSDEDAARLRDATGGEPIADWVAAMDRDEAAELLLAAGVAAAPVNREPDLVGSEMLMASGYWEPIEREFTGAHLYPGIPIVADGERWTTGGPAPLLGQHSDEIFVQV